MKLCEEIKTKILKEIMGYDCELYETENKRIYILTKSEKIFFLIYQVPSCDNLV